MAGAMVMAGVVGMVVRHKKMLHYNIPGVHVVVVARRSALSRRPRRGGVICMAGSTSIGRFGDGKSLTRAA